MVTDPYLAQHLAHWGINMMQVRGLIGGTGDVSVAVLGEASVQDLCQLYGSE
jgi:alpha-D-ribose 1-methylphosphonate 5-triphosphate synthase subunit PhnG